MNRKTLSFVAASLVVAGSLGAQPAKPAAKKVAPTVAAAPAAAMAAAPVDTTHKKPVAKKVAKKMARHDSTAKHDTTHAAPKKPTGK